MGRFQALVLVLCVGWSCFAAAVSDLLKDHLRGLQGIPGLGERSTASWEKSPTIPKASDLPQDTMSEHMMMIYDKYNKAGHQFKESNTVRSFKANLGWIGGKQLQIFNLTSLAKSEDILSATLHYDIDGLVNNTRMCPYLHGCNYRFHRKQVNINLSIWVFGIINNNSRILGHYVISTSTLYRDFLSWQWKDITRVVNRAKSNDNLLIGIEIMSPGPTLWKQFLSKLPPYILVFANYSAISELDSLANALQQHRASIVTKIQHLGISATNRTFEKRRKRSTNLLMPLHNNELPGEEYRYNEADAWETRKPYKKLHSRPTDQQRKGKQRKGNRQKSQTLQFDKQTLRKARRRQWNEPRNCARRYLKVDFADIGWIIETFQPCYNPEYSESSGRDSRHTRTMLRTREDVIIKHPVC
ncbi:bone morphogenetic protein 3 isoform X2 [Narcine bancroftii]|uniref:bone morphogenetic protein 3 isoform X2 n=1 Tax=Narcine bancroftii TaxID=1343680 RepID=UPI0038311157